MEKGKDLYTKYVELLFGDYHTPSVKKEVIENLRQQHGDPNVSPTKEFYEALIEKVKNMSEEAKLELLRKEPSEKE